jgi:hypothetical protein
VTSFSYWSLSFLGFVAGGGIAAAFVTSGTDLTVLLAANVGAAWPSIVNGFARGVRIRASSDRVD